MSITPPPTSPSLHSAPRGCLPQEDSPCFLPVCVCVHACVAWGSFLPIGLAGEGHLCRSSEADSSQKRRQFGAPGKKPKIQGGRSPEG